MKSPFAIFSIMLLFVGQGVFAQESRLIRWQFEAGDEYRIELKYNSGIKSNIERREKQIGSDMVLIMDWKIESAADDSFVIAQTIKQIQMTIRIPADEGIQTTRIDTDDRRQPGGLAGELLNQIQPLIGTTYSLTMTNRGQIQSMRASREAEDALREASARVQLGQLLTPQRLNQLLSQSAAVFPEAKIEVGEQWESSQEIENGFGKTRKTRRYQYLGQQQREGTDVDAFSVATELENMQSGNNHVEVVDFDEQGTIWFAPGRDRILESRIENRIQTRRNYRENVIATSVSTVVDLLMVKIP